MKLRIEYFLILIILFSFLAPPFARADEIDFKSDPTKIFKVVEKEAKFKKYDGAFSKSPSGTSRKIFSGQKLFIEQTGEWGGRLIYEGRPLIYKDKIEFNQLVFSPDHKVAIAFGVAHKPRMFFIGDGKILKKINFVPRFVQAFGRGFVVVGKMLNGDVETENIIVELNFSAEEVWSRKIDGSGVPVDLSVSPNGRFIVFSMDKMNGRNDPLSRCTYILDKYEDVLEKIADNDLYKSFSGGDNDTFALVSQKDLRIIDAKNKTYLFDRALDKKSHLFFVLPDENRGDKIVVGIEDRVLKLKDRGYRCSLNEISIIDPRKMKITRWNTNSKDFRGKRIFYSASENKVILRKPYSEKDESEYIDLEN